MVDRLESLNKLVNADIDKLSKGMNAKGAPGDTSFKDLLKKSVLEVNAMKQEADELQQKLATGEITDVSQVVNAVEKADLAFKLLMQIRNKLVDAYQEVMRMRV